jgi:hypothetical protein
MPKFGPGVLEIGTTGTEIDVSCLINGARITSTPDAEDPTTKLCGTVKPGARTYSWEFTGNIDIDPETGSAGLFALSQTAYGTEQSFVFTPNTADGTSASGRLIIDPLDFGADEYGQDMTSDFTWVIVDKPTYVWGTGAAGLDAGDEPVGDAAAA